MWDFSISVEVRTGLSNHGGGERKKTSFGGYWGRERRETEHWHGVIESANAFLTQLKASILATKIKYLKGLDWVDGRRTGTGAVQVIYFSYKDLALLLLHQTLYGPSTDIN